MLCSCQVRVSSHACVLSQDAIKWCGERSASEAKADREAVLRKIEKLAKHYKKTGVPLESHVALSYVVCHHLQVLRSGGSRTPIGRSSR